MTMRFEFKPERYDDGSGSDHWFSGPYKITKYDAIEVGMYTRKECYGAYFKPKGWKSWGNYVRMHTQYPTLEAAMQDCMLHAKAFTEYRENDSFHKIR